MFAHRTAPVPASEQLPVWLSHELPAWYLDAVLKEHEQGSSPTYDRLVKWGTLS